MYVFSVIVWIYKSDQVEILKFSVHTTKNYYWLGLLSIVYVTIYVYNITVLGSYTNYIPQLIAGFILMVILSS